MLTIASIMLALSVLTTSPALCKPYISVPYITSLSVIIV